MQMHVLLIFEILICLKAKKAEIDKRCNELYRKGVTNKRRHVSPKIQSKNCEWCIAGEMAQQTQSFCSYWRYLSRISFLKVSTLPVSSSIGRCLVLKFLARNFIFRNKSVGSFWFLWASISWQIDAIYAFLFLTRARLISSVICLYLYNVWLSFIPFALILWRSLMIIHVEWDIHDFLGPIFFGSKLTAAFSIMVFMLHQSSFAVEFCMCSCVILAMALEALSPYVSLVPSSHLLIIRGFISVYLIVLLKRCGRSRNPFQGRFSRVTFFIAVFHLLLMRISLFGFLCGRREIAMWRGDIRFT